MSSTVPKQFLELAGKPILLRTVESIAAVAEVVQVVVALPRKHLPYARALMAAQPMRIPVKCVAGGASRQESVRHGIMNTRPDVDLIMVHDAVRPMCDRDMIMRVLETAWEKGGAVPGLMAVETIQRVSKSGRVLSTPAREELYAIQTPQIFRAEIIRSALQRAHKSGFLGTDESSVVRWAGYPVSVVPGSPHNVKITRPLDLDIAELIISGRSLKEHLEAMKNSRFRIGQGIDYHRLVEGRKLILGGVDIPFEKGLEGHSDADALTHAICDALLGAAALGDIGRHFPDTDPAHRGRCSLDFLREVRQKVESAGWVIQNIDVTLLAQRPKLAPYWDAMKRNISESLGLPADSISIKATTTEGMNAEGRGEGISAQAVALLYGK